MSTIEMMSNYTSRIEILPLTIFVRLTLFTSVTAMTQNLHYVDRIERFIEHLYFHSALKLFYFFCSKNNWNT